MANFIHCSPSDEQRSLFLFFFFRCNVWVHALSFGTVRHCFSLFFLKCVIVIHEALASSQFVRLDQAVSCHIQEQMKAMWLSCRYISQAIIKLIKKLSLMESAFDVFSEWVLDHVVLFPPKLELPDLLKFKFIKLVEFLLLKLACIKKSISSRFFLLFFLPTE